MRHLIVKGVLTALACAVSVCASAMADTPRRIDVPPGELTTALELVSRKTAVELVFNPQQIKGVRTKGVSGTLSSQEAVRKLLEGTKLELRTDSATGAMMIGPSPAAPQAAVTGRASAPGSKAAGKGPSPPFRVAQVDQGDAGPQVADDQGTKKKRESLEEIVVTGTHIHGAKETSSPLRSIDRSQIDAAGVTTIESLLASAPENVGGIDVDTYRTGVAGPAGQLNHGNASGVNLRGLGSDATLVLLNGHRLPTASDGYSVDISTIPLSIVDHVDILKDGASSVYGSDAVAGVVNIVTLNKFEGALTGITGSTVTRGGKKDIKLDQMLGTAWDSGNVFASYTFDAQGSLSTTARTATQSAFPADAIPPLTAHALYVSFQQALGGGLDLHLDLLGSDRRYYQTDSGQYAFGTPAQEIYVDYQHIHNQSLVTSGSLEWKLPAEWQLTLGGQFAANSMTFDVYSMPTIAGYNDPATLRYKGRDHQADLTLDGPLFSLPGGEVRAAVGASYRDERYEGVDTATLSRHVEAGYAELSVPLVGVSNAVAGVRRVELTLSDRYDRYSDFGGTNNPKFGVVFSPLDALDFRAAYSTSFRAPLFAELERIAGFSADYLFNAPDALSPSGRSIQLLQTGGNPNLGPETAHSVTAGLEFHPQEIRGFSASIDFFSIDFKNRIETPSFSPFLAANPALYGAYINRNPSAALIDSIANGPLFFNLVGPFTAADVVAIDDNRYQNAGAVKVRGIDFDTRYREDLAGSHLDYSVIASYLLRYDDTLFPGAVPIERLNTAYYPTKLKLRAGTSWVSPTFGASLFANFVNSYTNNTDPTDIQPVGSFLTFDGQLSCSLPRLGPGFSEPRIALSVLNILNREPPFVSSVQSPGSAASGFNYDPVNASLLGRYISLELRTRW